MLTRLAAHAMGTRFEIVLDGDDEARLRAVGEAALEEIEHWNDRLNVFDPGSFVCHLNARAGEGPVALDDDQFDLLADCLRIHHASGGAFDVTVAPLMRAWGFRGGDAGRAEAETAAVGSDGIVLDEENRTVRFDHPDLAVDFGGIAKGHALDAAAAVVREHGVECAIIHGGTSTVVAIGAPPGRPQGQSWRVGIKGTQPPVTACLRDAALSVSAIEGRTVEFEGERLGHVIDPRTRAPSRAARLAAITGASARATDAWSTALLVLGERPPSVPEHEATLIDRGAGARPRLEVHDPGGAGASGGAVFEIDAARCAQVEEMT